MNGGNGSSSSGDSSHQEANSNVAPRRNGRRRNAEGQQNGHAANGHHEEPQPGPSRWARMHMNGGLRRNNEEQRNGHHNEEPQPGPSRPKRIRIVCNPFNPNRDRRPRSALEPSNPNFVPFPGYYSESDTNPINISRRRRGMRRRCYTPRLYFGDPYPGISPIGSENEFRSYSSSRASSVIDLIGDDEELENDVFYDDDEPPSLLDNELTWTTFLNYFVIGHLIPHFENAGIEFSHFWDMTTAEFLAIGIDNQRELAILAKIQHSYTGRSHLSD